MECILVRFSFGPSKTPVYKSRRRDRWIDHKSKTNADNLGVATDEQTCFIRIWYTRLQIPEERPMHRPQEWNKRWQPRGCNRMNKLACQSYIKLETNVYTFLRSGETDEQTSLYFKLVKKLVCACVFNKMVPASTPLSRLRKRGYREDAVGGRNIYSVFCCFV